MRTLEVFLWGGVIGIGLLALVLTLFVLWGGDPPPREEPCDCFNCTAAREWQERENGWA